MIVSTVVQIVFIYSISAKALTWLLQCRGL